MKLHAPLNRLIAALLLLAAPLAVAAWGLGSYSAQRERSNADTRLVRSLDSGGDAYPVLSKGRRVGEVVVFLPLRRSLVAALTHDAGLAAHQQLGVAHGAALEGLAGAHRIVAGQLLANATELRVGDLRYRAVSAALADAPVGTKLVALEPSSFIDSEASGARWRVVIPGFIVIAALLAMAYAVSPSIARSRVAKQEREQAERVLARVGDGIFLVDSDGVIRLWNQAAEAITGLRADAVRDRAAADAIPGWAAIAARVPVARRPGDADDASSGETVPLEVDGREVWLSIVGVTLADGIVYAFRDVTRERRLEELRAQFVATISHELRTPLASLHGAAMTLLERDLSGETRHELLDMIGVQAKRLAELVEEILVTGQLDSGTLRVVTEPFDPEELVWAAAAAARARVGDDRRIDVSIPAVLPLVAGDPDRIGQVLANLVDNAIKYSAHGGRIELGVEADDRHARFSVRDEGLGIPLGEQKRIFEKFYRLDPDHHRGIGGSGLGLYICRELVRSMDGRIWVDSDSGRGATFVFELPLAQRVAAAV